MVWTERPDADPITDGHGVPSLMKDGGYMMVIWSPKESAVAMVKPSVTVFPLA